MINQMFKQSIFKTIKFPSLKIFFFLIFAFKSEERDQKVSANKNTAQNSIFSILPLQALQ